MIESTADNLRRVALEVSALRALGRRLRDVSMKAMLLRARAVPALVSGKPSLHPHQAKRNAVLP